MVKCNRVSCTFPTSSSGFSISSTAQLHAHVISNPPTTTYNELLILLSKEAKAHKILLIYMQLPLILPEVSQGMLYKL